MKSLKRLSSILVNTVNVPGRYGDVRGGRGPAARQPARLRRAEDRRGRVDRISTADVMEVLLPIWSTRRETARRVRQRISTV